MADHKTTRGSSAGNSGSNRNPIRVMRELPEVFRVSVGAAIVATGVATVFRPMQSFDHGIWLIAYLLLVGSVAQYLLARGRSILVPRASTRLAGIEALLWSIGVLTVPVGVLAGIRPGFRCAVGLTAAGGG